jgi:hAT family C-terminal dimerisation region
VVTAADPLTRYTKAVFPNINTLLHILTVLPVTTAEPETVFSKVEKTLTSIRSTMTKDRVEALILLEVYRD